MYGDPLEENKTSVAATADYNKRLLLILYGGSQVQIRINLTTVSIQYMVRCFCVINCSRFPPV